MQAVGVTATVIAGAVVVVAVVLGVRSVTGSEAVPRDSAHVVLGEV